MDQWFEALNGALIRNGFHPFYLYAFSIWVVLLGVRAWFWRRRKYAHCERCDHEGFAKNTVRGSWKAELVRFVLFVPPGFFMHILMGIYVSYFLIRWFVIRECESCGSEKLVYMRAPRGSGAPRGAGAVGMAGYLLMLGGSIAVYFFIRAQGEQLPLPQALADTARRFSAPPPDALWTVLLALAVVIVAARGVGMLFKRFGQPPVMGEIVAGIALGPSLLGAVAPGVSGLLLPNHVAPFLGTIANIGVVLFMFLVGLELNTGFLRGRTQAAVTISHASMLAPFLLGSGLAYFLYDSYATAGTSFTVFSLFAGVSLSVTAFPVLARILTDNNLQRTPLGATALTCASVDDVTAWLLLALASSVAVAQPGGMAVTLLLVAAYLCVMMLLVRPIVARVVKSAEATEGVSGNVLTVVFVGLLLSAMMTEAIGIHALFGAFLFGALIPHDSRLAEGLRLRLQDTVVVLFLPAFFAFTGMRTELGLLSSATDWWMCGAIIVVATVGKFGGTALAARLTGFDWRESAALGALMNTRGLMELIVLNVGLDMGVLTPRLFTMLVIMAVVTTFATNPAIRWLMKLGAFSAAARAENRAAG